MTMKRFFRTMLATATLLCAAACARHTIIPDDELALIFHDAFLTNAYIGSQNVRIDSLNIYEPIFARYGYTTEDVQYTIGNFSKRKSARLGDVVELAIDLLEEEGKRYNREVAILDTIDNVAQRRARRTVLHDTMVRASRAADTALLRFVVDGVRTGEYVVSATYSLDSLDKASGRRYRVYWICDDSTERIGFGGAVIKGGERTIRHTLQVKEGEPKAQLVIDLNHFGVRKGPLPATRMTVEDIEVTYTPPAEECVEALYRDQLQVRIFSDSMIRMIEGGRGSAGANGLRSGDAASSAGPEGAAAER